MDESSFWTPPDPWDADDIALEMTDAPNVWTDGSIEDFSSIGGFEVAGAGVYLPVSEIAFQGAVWGVAEEYGDARLERCRVFMCVPGPIPPACCILGSHHCSAVVLAVSFRY